MSAAKSLVIPLKGGGDKTEVPAVLAKQGVGAVSDNLFPGDTLKVGRLFMNIFQPELEARLVRLPGQEKGGV